MMADVNRKVFVEEEEFWSQKKGGRSLKGKNKRMRNTFSSIVKENYYQQNANCTHENEW